MLVFSTRLIVNEKLTKGVFLQLIFDWLSNNRNYSFGEIVYDGKVPFELHCGTDNLEIEEYSETLTVRLTSVSSGIIWTNDYVLTTADSKKILAVQLYSDTENMAVKMPEKFNKPRVLGQIVSKGYGGMDQNLPVIDEAYKISQDNIEVAKNLVMREREYFMPVIYVSYPRYSIDKPIDFVSMAKVLSGVAHVVVETKEIASSIRKLTNGRNPYAGAVEIFYGKNNSYRVLPDNFNSLEDMRAFIENAVCKKVLMTKIDDAFSWMRIHFNHLQHMNSENPKLISLYEHLLKDAESDGEIKKQCIDDLELQIMELEDKIADLKALVAKKDSQIQTYKNRFAQAGSNKFAGEVTFEVDEKELYEGEIKDVILKLIEKERNLMDSSQNLNTSRKFHILQDVLCLNTQTGKDDEISECLENIIDKSGNINAQQKRRLIELGFEIGGKKHYKVIFNEDERYAFTLSKTPGDYRTNLNTLKDAVNTLFGR